MVYMCFRGSSVVMTYQCGMVESTSLLSQVIVSSVPQIMPSKFITSTESIRIV